MLSQLRLNVVQTEFRENVSFEMRTFRFITTGSSATVAQDQTVSCNLHLEPVNDVSSSQPDDCLCHTEADCGTPAVRPGIFSAFSPYYWLYKSSMNYLREKKSGIFSSRITSCWDKK